ncbi:MFS transporter permease [Thiorhodococcus mannitoliphagus]|uniref:MFS transporter permease n=1 Tax=Thiorhodococcus mannitoliphagus TaxID=329406 RepID=A0A6P1E3N9_9GAMM|nr:DUF6064 family protein [Thiorhodococcus mannitoliphagus]NEX22644.1 MFS transporter permease [Thiorhodococcus mannitoliphagus]
METLGTYALVDFIPVEPEVYFRLFARHNLSVWPSQLLAVPLGLLAIWFLRQGQTRIPGILLGLSWIWVGVTFHLMLHAELNWAAKYAGWIFVVEELLLLTLALPARPRTAPRDRDWIRMWVGAGLGLLGLLLYPLLPLVTQLSWRETQVFGTAPDPTALVTLGCLLMTDRFTWPLATIPLLWCVLSGATWIAIGWMPGLLLPAGGVIFIGLALWPRARSL